MFDLKFESDVSVPQDLWQCKPSFVYLGYSYFYVLAFTFEIWAQNLELWDMETAIKFFITGLVDQVENTGTLIL